MRASEVFTLLGLIGGLGGVATLITAWPTVRKMRAETRATHLGADTDLDRAEDEHWAAIVKAQAEAIVQPLREEVTALRAEVTALRREVEATRTRYWRAVSHIRALLAWIGHHHQHPPDLPDAPTEIAGDI